MKADRAGNRIAPLASGWRAVILIAATYVYFLIFAQFGFLKRLAAAGIGDDALKPVMAAMAAGGIAASLLAARATASGAAWRLRLALLGCAAAAACTLLPLSAPAFTAVAFLIGASLGVLTVTLVANLGLWTGARHPLLRVGIGTGVGYWICNIPAVFTATPEHVALVGIAACAAGLVAAAAANPQQPPALAIPEPMPLRFGVVLVWLTALVWFDSAAFFIIQNSPALKSGAWLGAGHLWRTGAIHFAAALLSVWILLRRGTAASLLAAFSCLSAAGLLLLNPAHSLLAAWLYPAGVSLYSVVLVGYASLLIPGVTAAQRARRAGWLYAVAGWVGSAMGIGMAQHLHRIPLWFVAAAAALFAVPPALQFGRSYWREGAAVALVALTAWALQHSLLPPRKPPAAPPLTAAERGRRVYIAEGCINCHSQYVRPHSHDVQLWGPAQNVEAIRREHPPLIGNRRQGPDLSEVGARRSPLWLRIHLIDPRLLSYDSPMPSYAWLFRDRRGSDLVAYLAGLKSPGSLQHILQEESAWNPPPPPENAGGSIDGGRIDGARIDGARLFTEYCATCHTPAGKVRTRWAADFRHPPPQFNAATTDKLAAGKSSTQLRIHLARVIKFGIPGTDMPGHEYMPDAQVDALAAYLARPRHQA